ncbi:hypothetical protein K7X08_006942 [Anisodus acutangulus]|uniref:Phorbol-ester/DAG-type domain-containing protein n=1 Tax=Anisodus acutangulus TaxID=402998 RepID=A0A9Q1LCZ8_9SOLA|nr:hypothetical protein K7X08_006942 [Anisodus acutangulus]
MPDDKKMPCLLFDDNNLEFGYLLGFSIWLPAIVLVYCLLKFLLQLLTHHPQNISRPMEGDTEIAKKKTSDASQAEDLLDEAKKHSSVNDRIDLQAVVYRFRQRQKKIQREITREEESGSKLIVKEDESCVSKVPRRLCDGDLDHFSHRHPMLRFHLRGTEDIRCNMCAILISGVAYGCDHCHYFLHEVCSNIPKRIRHDFHPMHSLTLLPFPSFDLWHSKVESEFRCVACGYDDSYPHHSLFSFYYHCDLCKFDLHLECASVSTTLIHKVKYPLDLFTFFPLESEGAALFCGICNQVMNRESSWLFYNRGFDYICHFECAAEEELGLVGDHSFLSEVQKSLVLQKGCPDQQPKLGQLGEVTHFSHRHPLKAIKQTNEASSIMSTCSICSNKASSGYICQRCNYFIDETCFPLPRKIQHHFHPNHPLILASYNDHPKFKCPACTQKVGAAYHCSACKFSLHRSCAGAPMTLTLGTNKKVSYKLLYSYPYENEMAEIKCSDCSSELNSKQSFLYYNFDLDEVLHVQCALDREVNTYGTKFLLVSERLKSIKIEEDHS